MPMNVWVILTKCIPLLALYRQTATKDRVKWFSVYDHSPSHSCTADFCISHSWSGRCAWTTTCPYEVALSAASHCINSTCAPHNGGQRPHAPHPLKASPWGRSLQGDGALGGCSRTRCQFVCDPNLFRSLVGESSREPKKADFLPIFWG